MRELVARFDHGFEIYLKTSGFLLNGIAIVMFCVMLGANAYNIFLRSVLGAGIMWHQEISIMAAFWIYFAAYGLLSKEEGYISVEFLFDRLAPRAQRLALIGIRFAVIAFHVIMFRYCLITFEVVSIYETPILEWPEFVYYIPLAVGTFDIILTESVYLLRFLAFPERARGGSAPPSLVG